MSLHFQHLSIPVMLFLINKVQKECTAVVKAVRITRSQYIREAVKKGYFLGIIPKPMDPPPPPLGTLGPKKFLDCFPKTNSTAAGFARRPTSINEGELRNSFVTASI